MGFWDQAKDQAGREFGARFWRWFAVGRVARHALPALVVAFLVGAAGLGAYTLYRWLSPDWGSVGSSAAGAALDVGQWILILAAVVAGVALVVGVGVAVYRANAWRWGRY